MISPCRQCIINSQRGSIDFVQKSSTSVSINVKKQPILAVFSHGTANYLIKINQNSINNWTNLPANCWLFWDIDLLSAKLSSGYTTISPDVGDEFPISPETDQHFFNITYNKMFIWVGNKWIETVRLFVGQISNSILNPQANVSQINSNISVNCGEIIFDHKDTPIRRFHDDGSFEFITTETFYNFQHINLSNHLMGSVQLKGISQEDLTEFTCIRWDEYNHLVPANYTDEFPAIGIVQKNSSTDEITQIYTHGYIKNINWQWYNPVYTSLFVGLDGEITTNIPNEYSIQKIGYIVSPNKIFLDIGNQIFINPSEVDTTSQQ